MEWDGGVGCGILGKLNEVIYVKCTTYKELNSTFRVSGKPHHHILTGT